MYKNSAEYHEWHKESEELAPGWTRLLVYVAMVLVGVTFWACVALAIIALGS